ncbi:dihydrodipicolinate synthase family protein [Aliivibrio fischeri]|uniref:dihydrodipicolinate synthase family protein n=1 Tax=Aliivibrio fischeri TaxID=668 RepID=UPI0006D216A7|nr:dihydrodipicolinate synthase family protein [Aliivibrio fischeri]USR97682.1 dihydrodipicolinate synthase family protein [Aliivibrio fischeri ATCC 7744 = JCM 18803 = DSM 507]GGK36560.1 dihydrodipicolinate synthase family protein [Aliivibrio fischeri]
MINAKDIYGVNPIVAMPFLSNGEVDFISFIKLLDHLKQTQCHGLTLFGIASEFYKLGQNEKQILATEFIGSLKDSDIYSCISVTEHSTELAVKAAREYQNKGVDSLMLLPPFFLKPSNKQIIEHIRAVLSAVTVPVLVQYAPAETGLPIEPSEMNALAKEFPHAVFKIECNPPVEYTQELLSLCPEAVVMNGYAGLFMLDMLSIGGKGVMPGCSFTEVYVQIYQHWVSGNRSRAKELHNTLFEYITEWMGHCEYIIAIEKRILQKRGIISSDYNRKPDYQLNERDEERIEQFLSEFKLSYK